jgi:hypothetical protein
MDRNHYADLLRVVAIGAVVYGHWILTEGRRCYGQTMWSRKSSTAVMT